MSHFLIGKKFIIETDHKPLIWIFGPSTAVKINVSPRLLRYSLDLMRFDYEIRYIRGGENIIADTLSRIEHDDNTAVPQVHFSEPCVSVEHLKQESGRDRFLSNLRTRIVSGDWSNLSHWEKHFKPHIKQLTLDNNIIRLGTRVVPPKSLYEEILRVAHQSHCGIKATLSLVANEFFWPNMAQTVRNHILGCRKCIAARFPKEETTHRWPAETMPWTRLHIDWAHCRHAGDILIIADSYSGWLEALICSNRTTMTVINALRSVFARFGVPLTLVSDNAPEYTSGDLKSWLASIGCELIHTPEYHPQSNGLAERMVRVVKDAMKCYNASKCTIHAFVHRLLFVHRNTVLRDGKTPAEILTGRKVRCPIISQYQPMQQLLYKQHQAASPTPVRFLFRQGNNTNLVAHPNNRTVLAHDAQLAAQPHDVLPVEGSDRPKRTRAPPQFFGQRYFL